jgi:hypothetical protein
MHPKPPVTRTARSGRLRHQAIRLKSLLAVGAISVGFAGAALIVAGPASADPAPQFVQVGSDTTENMMDYFAGQAGGGTLGSYDAVNPLTQIAGENITGGPALGGGAQELCSFTRPNGSGQGFKSLDLSYNPGTSLTTGLANNPQPGCIALSRSSGGAGSVASTGPGSSETSAPFGNFVYIPFGIDAVTYATGPTSATSVTTQCAQGTTGCTGVQNGIGTITFTAGPTSISQSADFSVSQLQTLYGSCSSVTVGGTTYNPVGTSFAFTATSASPAVFTASGSSYTAGTGVVLSGSSLPGGFTAGTQYFVVSPSGTSFELAATPGGTAINSSSAGSGTVTGPGNIDLYAPQNGSGTLSFWETTMGVSGVQPCWHQTIIAGPAAGIQVEEHDGSALASDPNGIAPISIAKWIGMSNGVIVPDVRHGDVLQSITVSGTPVAPISGGSMNVSGCLTGTHFVQSACFPVTREVFNVVDYYEVTNTAPTLQSASPAGPAYSFTATNGNGTSPAVFTASGTNYSNGQEVTLVGSSLPGGFFTNTNYYVTAATATTFELTSTPDPGTLSPASAPIASTSTGSGGVTDNPAYSPILAGLLAGSGSSLCTSSFTIENLGFGAIPSSNSAFTDPCGSTATSLRVQMNNSSAAG